VRPFCLGGSGGRAEPAPNHLGGRPWASSWKRWTPCCRCDLAYCASPNIAWLPHGPCLATAAPHGRHTNEASTDGVELAARCSRSASNPARSSRSHPFTATRGEAQSGCPDLSASQPGAARQRGAPARNTRGRIGGRESPGSGSSARAAGTCPRQIGLGRSSPIARGEQDLDPHARTTRTSEPKPGSKPGSGP
jgi:hypothetical protein